MKVKKSHVSIGLIVLILSLTLAGAKNQSFKPQYKLETPRTSAGEITIITPENKTYTEPDSGYYPSTFGFENDDIGSIPEEWVDISGGGCTSTVIDYLNNHEKVLDLFDISLTNKSRIVQTFDIVQTEGIIEFWHQTNDTSKLMDIRTYNEAQNRAGPYLGISSGYYRYFDGTLWHDVYTLNNDEWYHHKIEFNCITHTFNWYINGLLQDGGDTDFGNNDCDDIKQLWFTTSDPAGDYHEYFDAIGFSWDPNYDLGDNMDEGMFLSYDNTTSLDWQGYSLDGQANKTILGNATIPMPSEGTHQIQVFGNDTMGTMYESAVRHFSVDTIPPEISITYPSAAQEFSTPPSYILSITEENVASMWYTLNGGSNIPFSSETGVIDSTAWNSLSDGPVTIRFYVRDIADREVFEEVIVVKVAGELPSPPPEIPGYNIIALIGVTFAVTLLLANKKSKK